MTDNPEPRWTIRRDGRPLHAVDTRQDAETIGQLLIRAETCDPTVRVRWVCPVCDSEDDACPTCGDELPDTLIARGIITAGEYMIQQIRPTPTDQIRTRLTALAAAETANPSPVWAPVTHRCRPPFLARTLDCDCGRCCAAAPHEPSCSQPDRPECTCPDDAEYHLDGCPAAEGETLPDEAAAEEQRLCHEALEFDHQCRVCATEEQRPEAVPGTGY